MWSVVKLKVVFGRVIESNVRSHVCALASTVGEVPNWRLKPDQGGVGT